ncbi:MAG: flagellar biosynthesis anti-sigma factor FlgM [Nitrospirae bacterium]|nr:flagellar biosynthesis anti-sigma factor FlgM [Nitrospirota bacterium]
MIITDKVDISGAGFQSPDKPKGKVSVGQTAAGSMPEDQVLVSSQAKEIGKLQAAVNKLPDTRTDRVETVKNAVNAGTYNVKGEAVAGKVLKEAIIDSTI